MFPASEQARAWAAVLSKEVSSWPEVRCRGMFGFTGVHRRDKIFAALPRTKALHSPDTFLLKFQKRSGKLNKRIDAEPKLHRGKKWCWMEVESDRDLPLLIEWLGRAYEAAK